MIMTLFLFMGLLGAGSLILGYTQHIPWATYLGYTIFFVLFTGFRVDGLQYETSTQIIANGNDYTVTPVYSSYSSNWISILLAMVSLFGLVYTWFSQRGQQ
jgi:uncharacterized membrane protein